MNEYLDYSTGVNSGELLPGQGGNGAEPPTLRRRGSAPVGAPHIGENFELPFSSPFEDQSGGFHAIGGRGIAHASLGPRHNSAREARGEVQLSPLSLSLGYGSTIAPGWATKAANQQLGLTRFGASLHLGSRGDAHPDGGNGLMAPSSSAFAALGDYRGFGPPLQPLPQASGGGGSKSVTQDALTGADALLGMAFNEGQAQQQGQQALPTMLPHFPGSRTLHPLGSQSGWQALDPALSGFVRRD